MKTNKSELNTCVETGAAPLFGYAPVLYSPNEEHLKLQGKTIDIKESAHEKITILMQSILDRNNPEQIINIM